MPYSFSQIDSWMTCPASLRFYRQKVKVPEAPIMQAGALAHAVYEEYFRHCLRQGRQTDITAIEVIAGRIYRANRAEYAEKRKAYLTDEEFREVLVKLIKPFAESHIVDGDCLAEIEQRIAITEQLQQCDWMAKDVWFRAVIDALYFPDDTTAEVVDYKTGFSFEPNPLQFDIYAWFLFALYPHIEKVICVFDYTRFDIQKPMEYERDQFDELDAKVRELCRAIEADTEMLPAPGAHCMTCQYAHLCEAKAEAPNEIVTEDDAKKTIEAISLWERDLKDAKERLRLYCTANGNVAHNGVEWGHHAQGDRCFPDAKALHDRLVEDEKNPWLYLSVSATKTKKLLDQYADLTESNRKLVFTGRKIKGGDDD